MLGRVAARAADRRHGCTLSGRNDVASPKESARRTTDRPDEASLVQEEIPLLDDATIRELLRADYARLVNAVALVAGSFAAAEDAVQEAIVRAWTTREAIASPVPWVAVVAMNLSRSTWRRTLAERRARERLGESRTWEAETEEDRVDVVRALAALPRRQREVAVLRYLLQFSTEEAADALGVGSGTVKNSLAKARASLAVALREIDDAEVTPDARPR